MNEQTTGSNLKRYAKDDIIFSAGEPSNCMYEVKRGTVGIYINLGQENEKKIAELSPGRVFGEMGMVEGLPRSATAVAMDAGTSVSVITWDTFGIYFRENPSRVVQIMQQISDRLRLTTKINNDSRNSINKVIASLEKGCSQKEAASMLKSTLLMMDLSYNKNK